MQTKSENIGYLTVEERWEALISQLVSLRGKPNLNEDDLRVDVLHLVKGLNLVQRFDWPKWRSHFRLSSK